MEKGWPDPFTDTQRQTECMEFFVRGLTPPALKQKAHQYLIETPHTTWEHFRNHVSTKYLSSAVRSDFTGTASSSIDNKMDIEVIKDQLKDLASLKKNNRISAAYNPNEPKNKQNHTRFCKICKKSGHTIAYCYTNRDFKEQNRKQPQQRDKFRDNYQNYRGRRPREDSYDRNQNRYRQEYRPKNSYFNQDNRRQYSLILDLRKITSEIAHKALRIEMGAIVADPTIVDTRTTGTIQGNDNKIEKILEQVIVSQTVPDMIIEEVTVLIRILEITAESVIQTEFNSEKIRLMDSLWTINKFKFT